MNMKKWQDKTGLALVGAVIAAVTASLCCTLPLIAVMVGVTGFAASEVFAPWRPYFLGLTFGLLALGFYLTYRPRREACESGGPCERPPWGSWNRFVLWLATGLVILFSLFPYYGGWVVRAVTKPKQLAAASAKGSTAHVVLAIEGLDCPVCSGGLQQRLSQLPGVRHVEVSFQDKQASIDYDPRAVDPSQFSKVVAEAGFGIGARSPASN